MQKLPIVTVTFEDDFRLTILQVLSVDRLFAVEQISSYMLILNCRDDYFEVFKQKFVNQLKGAISVELFKKIRFYAWSDFYAPDERVGFYDQQLLKLGVSMVIDTPTYLLLDGKNHFVRPSSFDDFFADGKPIGELVETITYWRGNLEGSMRLVGIQPTKSITAKMFPSITPIVMYSEIVRELIEHLQKRHNCSLSKVLEGREGYATEFLLYYSFLLLEKKAFLYANRPTPVNTLFTIKPTEDKEVARYIEECYRGEKPMFGLHRRRIPKLTSAQRSSIEALWRKHLLQDWEQTSWFID